MQARPSSVPMQTYATAQLRENQQKMGSQQKGPRVQKHTTPSSSQTPRSTVTPTQRTPVLRHQHSCVPAEAEAATTHQQSFKLSSSSQQVQINYIPNSCNGELVTMSTACRSRNNTILHQAHCTTLGANPAFPVRQKHVAQDSLEMVVQRELVIYTMHEEGACISADL